MGEARNRGVELCSQPGFGKLMWERVTGRTPASWSYFLEGEKAGKAEGSTPEIV